MAEPARPRLIYTLDRPRAYRVVTAVLALLALVLTWLGWSLTTDAMLADFGSIAAGRLFQVGIIILGFGALAAWLWFKGRFILRMTWLPSTEEVQIECSRVFGRRTRRLAVADFIGVTAHEGRSDFPGAPSVRAPYRRLRIRGAPTLILDDQGTVHDRRLLDRILAGWSSDTPKSARRRPRR